MKRVYRVVAERDDGWWLVRVPELDAVTQAKRADKVEYMARDLIATWLDVDPDSFEVTVELALPDPLQAEVESVRQHRARAQVEADAAAREARHVAEHLHARGLSYRDVGVVLGVSFQRAKQLADEARELQDA